MALLFWILIGLVVWTYAGYPLLLSVLARYRKRELTRGPNEPSVSLIIAAYNEERDIREKLLNTLALDYPAGKLEIIVASDCSTDGTHDIVREFADRGVKLVTLGRRAGKTAAQNAAANVATGDILVFSDATTEFAPRALRDLLEYFADPRVGCVGSVLQYESAEGTAVGKGAGAYWRYETAVKHLEGRVNSMIGVSGCLYAVRAQLYGDIEPDLISDFVIALEIYKQGYVTVPSVAAVSRERTHEDPSREFEMRVRIIVRSINALVRKAALLNPFRYGFFAVQLISHKVLRYLVPELLLGALAVNAVMVFGNPEPAFLYQLTLAGQLLVLIAAAVGWLGLRWGFRLPLVHIPFYFVHANAAALWGLMRYLAGERKVTWTTVRT
jgi:cellulose synthase/poly-beta-1,6-N-acetylglucosamine synthase-like glycosyltransferase